jgi:hypothetical protein
MSNPAAISIDLQWRDEEGDGTECFHCGDAAWLSQCSAFFRMDSGEWFPIGIVLCQSCAEGIE